MIVSITGRAAVTTAIIAALENSAMMHVVESYGVELKPQELDNYNRANMPTLPHKQTYVPPVNRKSKRY